ncbi:HEPN domain-containing protein [Actinoplanes philippinensis]|uniref:HEPN domain-containing protein n=1 Tax=Actinoplanes philippinensis TaxID=35752 RepID=UPI0033CFC584
MGDTPADERPDQLDAEFSNTVAEQIFDLFITPELDRRGGLKLEDVRKAVVLLPPDGPPEVKLNEEASLIGEGRATRQIQPGEAITVDDISEITSLWPAQDPGNSGWVAMTRLPSGEVVLAFDFLRNKEKARKLIELADQFFSSATDSIEKGRVPVVIDAIHTTAELAVTAFMYLTMEQPGAGGRRSGLHAARTTWLDQYSKLGNLPEDHSYALRRLSNLRPAARYGNPPLQLKTDELPKLVQNVRELLEAARDRVGPVVPPVATS